MSLFDLVLIAIIAAFTLSGFWFGLIHTLGSLLGTVLATYVASRWYVVAADWLMGVTGWTGNFSKVLMFIIIFFVINRLIGFGFYLVERALALLSHLPFIAGLNRFLGAVFGFIEGLLIVGISLYFITKFPLSPEFMAALARSKVAPLCTRPASVLWPLIPAAIQEIKSALNL